MSDGRIPIKSRNVTVNQPSMSGLQNVPKDRTGLKGMKIDVEGEKIESTFKCRRCTYSFSAINNLIDHNDFFSYVQDVVLFLIA